MSERTVGDPTEEPVVEVDRMVHGGHALAYFDGHTLLVRHAMPGERVRVRITSRGSRVWHAEAVEILERDPRRRTPVCAVAVPGGCGGCDWQFAPIDLQRTWKAEVLAESFRRFAPDVRAPGVPVQPLDDEGLQWRTRASWHLDDAGRAGYLAYRSAQVVVPSTCHVLTPGLEEVRSGIAGGPLAETTQPPRTGRQPRGHPKRAVRVTGQQGERGGVGIGTVPVVREVRGRSWKVPAQSFWQAHGRLPRVLVEAVLSAGRPQVGETWWDLYAGSGVFSAFLSEAVGTSGWVHAVESDGESMRAARRALHDRDRVRLHHMRVEDWLTGAPGHAPSGVVLDPPRTGAAGCVRELADHDPRVIVYVACDPVALARDAQALAERGYRLATLVAFDAFPMTHHMECVASFVHEIS